MNETTRADRWPAPHNGGDWWSRSDRDIGTADYGSNYLWDVRIRLQVRIVDGVITDARCHVEDMDSDPIEDVIAQSIANFLKGKTPTDAIRYSRAAPTDRTWWDRVEAVKTGQLDATSHPADLMWSVSFAEDATRAALTDWATKAAGRTPLLPLPKKPAQPPPWRRLLRRIPFLKGLGL